MESLAHSLSLVLPEVPEILVPRGDRERISTLAGFLPSIHCAGFEIRLDGSEQPVDFAQRIVAFDGEPTRLGDHIDATFGARAHRSWADLAGFARDWARPASAISDEVAGVWLEFDADDSPPGGSAPSLFVSLRTPVAVGEEKRLIRLVEALCTRFDDLPPTADLVSMLTRVVDNCVDGACISDLGLMLARPGKGIRLTAAPLEERQVARFLGALDWPGDERALSRALAIARGYDELTVSFDLAAGYPGALPRVGVEYFPGTYLADLPHWQDLLSELVRERLCAPEVAEALLGWPGYTVPATENPAWPAALIVESMLRAPEEFSVIGRRLSHVKVTCGTEEPIEAKAYFGFGPLWLRPDTTEVSRKAHPADADERRPHARETIAARAEPSLEAGLRSAIGFLRAKQSRQGCWCDFDTVSGGSDEWVTAYVAAELAGSECRDAGRSARQAWRWLLARRGEDDGWGFNSSLPHDADGTAWGLLLAHALGTESAARARAARNALEAHTSDAGGVSSYREKAGRRLRETLGERVSMAGLFAPHLCVTAAAALVPGFRHTVSRFLREHQHADGRWVGYWWCDDEYPTGIAALALGGSDDAGARGAARRGADWASTRIRGDGAVISGFSGEPSAFCAASAALAILGADASGHAGRDADGAAARAVRWLLEAQRADGSWEPSALMRIPPADATVASDDAFGAFVGADTAAIFTTATALRTLRLFRAQES